MTFNESCKIFANFLKENNALKQYLSNIRKYQTKAYHKKEFFTIYGAINPLCHICVINYLTKRPIAYIKSAFAWDETEEKFDFWYSLNIKWEHLCKNNNMEII